VLNVPGPELWKAEERLAPLTGKCPVPEAEAAQFRYEPDKFGASGLIEKRAKGWIVVHEHVSAPLSGGS
jgi:hypothetical protein